MSSIQNIKRIPNKKSLNKLQQTVLSSSLGHYETHMIPILQLHET